MGKALILVELANKVAKNIQGFFDVQGPGKGNKVTNEFMSELGKCAKKEFGEGYSENKICGDNNLAVDYYFPGEGIIVEIALSLKNPNTEYEKDILKASLAKSLGNSVKELWFVSKPGGKNKCKEAGREAFKKWLKDTDCITIEIFDLKTV